MAGLFPKGLHDKMQCWGGNNSGVGVSCYTLGSTAGCSEKRAECGAVQHRIVHRSLQFSDLQ